MRDIICSHARGSQLREVLYNPPLGLGFRDELLRSRLSGLPSCRRKIYAANATCLHQAKHPPPPSLDLPGTVGSMLLWSFHHDVDYVVDVNSMAHAALDAPMHAHSLPLAWRLDLGIAGPASFPMDEKNAGSDHS